MPSALASTACWLHGSVKVIYERNRSEELGTSLRINNLALDCG